MKKWRKKNSRMRLMADLNLTNLIDVILTVLIIFMITAPMMTQGVQVDLPETASENIEVADGIQVSVTGRNEIYIDQRKTSLLEFKREFRLAFAGRVDIPVFINADKRIPYGLVMQVIADVQQAGVIKLGFLTYPLEKKK